MSDRQAVPAHISDLFWSVSPDALHEKESGDLIMREVLSRGTWEDATWLFRTYGREAVSQFVREDVRLGRQLPRGARKLWAILLCLDLPRGELEDRPGERWYAPLEGRPRRAN